MLALDEIRYEICSLKELPKITDLLGDQIAYQEWYSKSQRVISSIEKERLAEFIEMYEGSNRTSGIKQFFLTNIDERHLFHSSAVSCLYNQIAILSACDSLVDPFYQDILGRVYFEYQEDELETAKKLMEINIRAAGALAGVILEKHLKRVCTNHKITGMEEKTLNPIITVLYTNSIIDLTVKKNLDYLSDIRNKCDHSTQNEPTEIEVNDLITHTGRHLSLLS